MRRRRAIIALALGAAAIAVGCKLFMFSGDVEAVEAHRLVEAGALLLDVRSPEEYAEGHIEGAVNIPVDDLPRRMAELPAGRPIVVYCRSGMRSARAAEALRAAGRADVHDLGAMSRW